MEYESPEILASYAEEELIEEAASCALATASRSDGFFNRWARRQPEHPETAAAMAHRRVSGLPADPSRTDMRRP